MPAAAAQLTCSDLGFSYGPRRILNGVGFTLGSNDRLGIVAPNGAGKSTLLRLLCGELAPENGSVRTSPPSATVGLLRQTLDDQPDDTVESFVARATGIAAVVVEFDAAVRAVEAGDPNADDRYDLALTRWLDADAASFPERLDDAMQRAGLAEVPTMRRTETLSGGQRGRLGLAVIMLAAHDIVLLDEPTNDLDHDGLSLLEQTIGELDRATAVVSHDRVFLANVTTAILEIDEHTGQATRYNGGFEAWRVERQRAADQHQRDYDDYQARRATLAERARREKQWAAKGVRGAHKGDGATDKFIRAHRIATSERLAGKAKQTERALERLERNEAVDAPWRRWDLRLRFGEAERSGNEVASLHGAVIERGEPDAAGVRLGPLDLVVESGDRILITGANGSGKTTLLDALLGDLAPVRGTHRLGPSVRVGVLDQRRRLFADAEGLLDAFASGAGLDDADARSQLAKLGLDPTRLDRPVTTLSPGERTRASLGLFAATGTNLLVCDEPTNHLDLPAIEALEQALDRYPHTLVLVTHDRRLIERVSTTRRWHLADGLVHEN